MECFWVKNFGVQCPGCGVQRSFSLLINGDILNSIIMFPALIPTIIMFCFLLTHLFFRFKNGQIVILNLLKLNALLIFLNYTIRILY